MPTASRSVERFAAALEDGAAADGADAETGRMTAIAHRLEAVPTGAAGPPPAARAAALAAFSAGAVEVARHTAPAAAGHGAATTAAAHVAAVGHGLLLPLATGITAAAVAVSGVGVAAHRSLPGDLFYGVKRATEDVQLHLAGGGVSGAKERLAIARTRLAEIRAESAGSPSPTRTARIAALVASMDRDIALASGPLLAAGGAALLTLQTTVKELGAGLAALPADAVGPAVSRSQALLAALSTATAKLLATSGLPGTPLLPTTGPSSRPTTAPGGTPGQVVPVLPTTLPTAAPTAVPTLPGLPTPSGGSGAVPTHPPTVLPTLPSALPSGVPSLPGVLPSISVPVSVPSLPLPISSVLGGLRGR